MSKTQYLRDDAEELLNSLTHAVTFGISIMCTYILVNMASLSGKSTWPYYMFGISMSTTFLGSMLYHGVLEPVLKSRLRTFDLVSIFIAIAGGFISFFRIMLPDSEFVMYTGLSVLLICTCIFVKFKVFKNTNSFIPALGVYLIAGWANVLFLLDSSCLATSRSSTLILLGGILYTAGSAFYLFDYRRYFHTIWHLCASCGYLLHVSALVYIP